MAATASTGDLSFQELEGSVGQLEELLRVILPNLEKCIVKKVAAIDHFYTDGMSVNAIAKLEIYDTVVDKSQLPDCLFRTAKLITGYVFSRTTVYLTPHDVKVYKAVLQWLGSAGQTAVTVSK